MASINEFRNKVICGDCLEILPEIPNESIDVIIGDPPFFNPSAHYISRDTSKAKRCYGDTSIMKIAFRSIAKELGRVMKKEGHTLIFCDCVSYPVFFEAFYDFYDYTRALIWYKGKNYFSLGRGAWRYSYEMVLHSFNKNQFYVQLDRQDVLNYSVVPQAEREHQAEKPVELIESLINATTVEKSIILDPFAGSGTTLIAAKKLGKDFIGVEINPDYCKIAERRLANIPDKRLEAYV